MPDTEREMNIFLDQVDDTVDQQQVDGERREAVQEVIQQRRNQQTADQGRCTDAKTSGRLMIPARQCGFDFLEFRQDRLRPLIENSSIFGQRQAPRGAQQQPRPEMLFQFRNLSAHRGERTRK